MRQGVTHSPDGTPIFFRHWDAGSPLTLLLCDGLGCAGFIWKYFIPHFEKQYNLLHFNYRAHGHSGVPPGENRWSVDALIEDMQAVVSHINPSPGFVVPIGHSLGAQVMFAWAERHPEKVPGLISLCGTYGQPLKFFHGTRKGHDLLPHLLNIVQKKPRWAQYIWERILPSRLSFEVARIFEFNGLLVKNEDFETYFQELSQVSPQYFFSLLEAVEASSVEPFLRQTELPCLILAGEEDKFTPKGVAQKMYRLLKNGELAVERGLTHVAPIELPELIHLRIESFIKRKILPGIS